MSKVIWVRESDVADPALDPHAAGRKLEHLPGRLLEVQGLGGAGEPEADMHHVITRRQRHHRACGLVLLEDAEGAGGIGPGGKDAPQQPVGDLDREIAPVAGDQRQRHLRRDAGGLRRNGAGRRRGGDRGYGLRRRQCTHGAECGWRRSPPPDGGSNCCATTAADHVAISPTHIAILMPPNCRPLRASADPFQAVFDRNRGKFKPIRKRLTRRAHAP